MWASGLGNGKRKRKHGNGNMEMETRKEKHRASYSTRQELQLDFVHSCMVRLLHAGQRGD